MPPPSIRSSSPSSSVNVEAAQLGQAKSDNAAPHSTEGKLRFHEDGGENRPSFSVYDEQGVHVGKLQIVADLSPIEIDAQKKMFEHACQKFTDVREDQAQDSDPACINAQYINALKEKIHLDNGQTITPQKNMRGEIELLVEGNGQSPQTLAVDLTSSSTEAEVKKYIKDNNTAETHRDNSSRSIGVSLQTGKSIIHLGDAEEKFTIQSISKVFSDITLELAEQNLHANENGEGVAIISLSQHGQAHAAQAIEEGNYTPRAAPEHLIEVRANTSEHAFNRRENLSKERSGQERKTLYAIANASNNYGAIPTTGRIPETAIIDGTKIKGRENVVMAVMEGMLGAHAKIQINQDVLSGELADTAADHAAFLKTYETDYLPAKAQLKAGAVDWAGLSNMKPEELEKQEPAQRRLRSVLDGIKAGGAGPELQRMAASEQWTELNALMCSTDTEQWGDRKNVLELAKPHLPDNLTRTLWLMRKGAFPDAKSNLNLQIAETEIQRATDAHDTVKLTTLQKSLADSQEIMAAYTTHCAFEGSCQELAALTYPIASQGKGLEGTQPLSAEIAEDVIKQMKNGGLYNEAGKVPGIANTPFEPTKSGVGGGMISAVTREAMIAHVTSHTDGISVDAADKAYVNMFGEGGISLAVLSRPLNASGNSVNGLRLVRGVGESLVRDFTEEALRAA